MLANLKGKPKKGQQDSGDPQNVLSLEVPYLLYGCILPCVLAVLRGSSSLRNHGKHVKTITTANQGGSWRESTRQTRRAHFLRKPFKLGLVSCSDDLSPSCCRHDFGERIYSFPFWGRRIKRTKHGSLKVFSSIVLDTF